VKKAPAKLAYNAMYTPTALLEELPTQITSPNFLSPDAPAATSLMFNAIGAPQPYGYQTS
jgi:hypothetical protein